MSRQDKFPKAKVLGLDIDAVTIEQATDYITEAAKTGQSGYISKPYVEFFGKKSHQNDKSTTADEDLKQLLDGTLMCLPEGVAMQWAAYYQTSGGGFLKLFKTLAEIAIAPSKLKSVIPEKFGGTNFTWPLLEAAAERNLSVYLVGSPINGQIEDTAQYLRDNIKNLKIVGTMPGRDIKKGFFTDELKGRLINDLGEKKPDIVLLGIGFPRQEFLARELALAMGHGIYIGEGGTFDYRKFGGKLPKAPVWLQKMGLEWLWRLLLQPSRVRRQLAIPRFIIRVYKHDLRARA